MICSRQAEPCVNFDLLVGIQPAKALPGIRGHDAGDLRSSNGRQARRNQR